MTTLPWSLHAQGIELDLIEVAAGLTRPVVVTHAGDGSGRLFIAEQTGKILVLAGGVIQPTPFLDLSAEIVGGTNEQGLLGLAFHPDYESNGFFFVNYTEEEVDPPVDCPTEPVAATCDANTVVARYQVSAQDENVADPLSAQVLFRINQPYANHNGGNLAFGPDGFLYIATGDGGSGGDPLLNGQNPGTLHGSILRIDVDASPPADSAGLCGVDAAGYGVPADNPFVGQAGACPEIWSYGLRNPWRFSFDRTTGDMFIGDVGQNSMEEIDFQSASSDGGENYGWNCYEGTIPYSGGATCSGPLVFPILEYPHSNPADPDNSGRSVTGGFRYRGTLHPRLDGVYVYADFIFRRIWGTVPRCDDVWESRLLVDAPFLISTFGEDESGEIYATEFRGGNPPPATSKVYRLAVSATSGGPDLSMTPAAIDFGSNVEIGTFSAREVFITNVNAGPEALIIESLAVSEPGLFRIDPSGGTRPCASSSPCLAPGESCSVSVVLSPASPGPAGGSITVSANSESETVDLAATAVTCAPGSVRLLASGTITDTRTESACTTLAVGPYVVANGGRVQLVAGEAIEIRDGFAVTGTGEIEALIDPALLP